MSGAALLAERARPALADVPVGVEEPHTHRDNPRDYFPNVAAWTVAPYTAMVGPLTATPGLTLADVVRAVAGP